MIPRYRDCPIFLSRCAGNGTQARWRFLSLVPIDRADAIYFGDGKWGSRIICQAFRSKIFTLETTISDVNAPYITVMNFGQGNVIVHPTSP